MKPGTDSDFKPVTFWLPVGMLPGIISQVAQTLVFDVCR
jgi:hypothetical protein